MMMNENSKSEQRDSRRYSRLPSAHLLNRVISSIKRMWANALIRKNSVESQSLPWNLQMDNHFFS